MPLLVLRFIFLLAAAGVATLVAQQLGDVTNRGFVAWGAFAAVILLAIGVIALDVLFPKKRLETISAVYFGMVVGLFLTYILGLAINPLVQDALRGTPAWVNALMAVILCYGCISLLIQTKDDFRFIIPYVEFAKEVKGLKPYVLDTSVVIDGRIADVVETEVLDNQLIMPRFVIAELQAIADSSDRMRRSRGRRGLDILNRLRANPKVDLKIFDLELPEFAGQSVDLKLVTLAKHLEGKVVTGDYNLNKVARLHGVGVINLNDLANALKPVFLPGEIVEVRIVKAGEEPGQGVGYLDDGTMIVVEGGRDFIGQGVRIGVTSVLQTSAGRMIFGRYESTLAKAHA